MDLTPRAVDAPDDGAVLAIDVGSHTIKTAIVGPGDVEIDRRPTLQAGESWGIELLCAIATDLEARACTAGRKPEVLAVTVNGQVDEYHGAVQHSPNLPWHDVGVKDLVGQVVDTTVVVRHSVRAAALAETNLGSARGPGGVLYISLGEAIIAAGASGGVVVADHVGAGDIGQGKIRSGPGAGQNLQDFASAQAIARRYAQAVADVPTDSEEITAADVHARLGTDPVARRIWDEAMAALADGLEWATIVFAPETVVLGGGLARAGDDLLRPVAADITRRMGPERAPIVRLAAFGQEAGLVGGVLTGWKMAGWSIEQLDGILQTPGGGSDSGRR